MAGRRKPPPGEPSPMKKVTERVNKGREQIARARKSIDPDLLNESDRAGYKPEYADQALRLCLLNYTNEDLAKFFEVSLPTVNRWIAEVPAFKAAVYAGREEADMEMVSALRRCGLGYTVQLKEEKVTKEGDVVEIQKDLHVPSNFNAIQLWLANRHRDRWKIPTAAAKEEGGGSGAGGPDVKVEGGLPD